MGHGFLTMANQNAPTFSSWVSKRYLSGPFWAVHAIALIGPFIVGIRWEWVLLAVATFYLRMFGITAGYHRYFSHRTYKTSRVFQFLLALLGTTSVQKGVLWWSANHRDHHRYSDTDKDVHSPRKGFIWSHMWWILVDDHFDTKFDRIKDFAKYRELRWLNTFHIVPVVGFAVLTWLVGGWGGLVWGFFVSTVLLWHSTFFVNSINHIFGYRRFKSGDDSTNNWWVALLTMGEGWHNNHHYYQATVRQGFYWYEIDLTYYILRGLSALGIVWDLRMPPERVLEEGHALDQAHRNSKTIGVTVSPITEAPGVAREEEQVAA